VIPVASPSQQSLNQLARGGSLNLLGGMAAAGFNLALIVVLTRVLGLARAGVAVSVVALFMIVAVTTTLGVDTGLVRFISGRARSSDNDLRSLLVVSLVPVAAISGLAAVVAVIMAPAIGRMIGDGRLDMEVAQFVRVSAPFLVASSLLLGVVGATRGYGTMKTTVVIERILRPGLQVLLILGLGLAGTALGVIALGWSIPYVISLAGALLWLAALHRKDEVPIRLSAKLGETARRFWRFTLPRSFAATFRVALQWLDVVFVAALASPEAAVVYGVATRLIQFGLLAAFSVSQAVEPRLAHALSEGRKDDALHLYRVATVWLILLTWPIYITLTLFAPAILNVFGPEFVAGEGVVIILAVSVMFGAASGPVDILLLMAGKSSWSLANTAVALTISILLNLLLIPVWGIAGAAVAWSASRIVGNVLPLIQASRGLRMKPFGAQWLVAITISAGIFLIVGASVRYVTEAGSLPGAVAAAIAGGIIYLLALRRFRKSLAIDALAAVVPWRKSVSA
jgi:O-antigen/teichoic acid export membrane protein